MNVNMPPKQAEAPRTVAKASTVPRPDGGTRVYPGVYKGRAAAFRRAPMQQTQPYNVPTPGTPVNLPTRACGACP